MSKAHRSRCAHCCFKSHRRAMGRVLPAVPLAVAPSCHRAPRPQQLRQVVVLAHRSPRHCISLRPCTEVRSVLLVLQPHHRRRRLCRRQHQLARIRLVLAPAVVRATAFAYPLRACHTAPRPHLQFLLLILLHLRLHRYRPLLLARDCDRAPKIHNFPTAQNVIPYLHGHRDLLPPDVFSTYYYDHISQIENLINICLCFYFFLSRIYRETSCGSCHHFVHDANTACTYSTILYFPDRTRRKKPWRFQ